jgi:hypothetical protein
MAKNEEMERLRLGIVAARFGKNSHNLRGVIRKTVKAYRNAQNILPLVRSWI